MSAELAVNDGCQQSWTTASLSSSPVSSYEDVNERNAEEPADLSSFILINEGNSFGVPGSVQDSVQPRLQGSTNFKAEKTRPSSADALRPAKSPAKGVNSSEKFICSSSSGERPEISNEPQKPVEACKAEKPVPAFKMQAVESQVSQREAILAVNANKELKLKVAKLMGILDKKTAEVEVLHRNVIDQQSKYHILCEERRKLVSDLQSKDAVIADLKQKVLNKADKSQQNDQQGNLSEKVKHLEKTNMKISAENAELKQKINRLSLENKTLFERSTVLLSQIQDSETKRAVETCERQVLEGKIDHLIEETTKMKRELQDCKDNGFYPANEGGSQGMLNFDKKVGPQPSGRRDPYWPSREQAASKNGAIMKERVGIGSESRPIIIRQDKEIYAPHELRPQNWAIGSHGSQHNTREPHHPRNLDDIPQQFPGSAGGNNATKMGDRGVPSRDKNVIETECPMCGKKLSGVESFVAIHVERCIQLSELKKSSRQELQKT